MDTGEVQAPEAVAADGRRHRSFLRRSSYESGRVVAADAELPLNQGNAYGLVRSLRSR
ncbi:hypothetical protein [Succinimonas sp.]|uniref:hypothetical protein n=1 Tax=Succinimonas sp. TaxID=1936151 RepID=UPI003866B90E